MKRINATTPRIAMESHQYATLGTGLGASKRATSAAIAPPPVNPPSASVQLRFSAVTFPRSLMSAFITSCWSTAVAFRNRASLIASIPSLAVKSSLVASRVFSAAGRNPLGELSAFNASLICLTARPRGSLGCPDSIRDNSPSSWFPVHGEGELSPD